MRAWAISVGVALGLLVGCSVIWDLPDRELDPRVACSGGACTCAAGYGDCDGDEQNGCEIELAASVQHCGACGRDCQGGACGGGRCQPVPVVTASMVTGLAIDPTHVYWTTGTAGGPEPTESAIRRVPRDGGQPEELKKLSQLYGPTSLRVHDGQLYWAESSAILTQPAAGGAIRTVTTAPGKVDALFVHPPHLYFAIAENIGFVGSDCAIERAPISGGASERLHSRQNCVVVGLAVDDERIDWLESSYDQNRWMTAPVAGGEPTRLGGAFVQAIATDDTNAYWLDRHRPEAGSARDTLFSKSKKSGTESTLATDQFETRSVISNGSHVFWSANAPHYNAGSASLMKVSVQGGSAEELTRTSLEPTVNIVADETTIFWATPERIMKLSH